MRIDHRILLVPVSDLRPTEETMTEHVFEVKADIERAGIWTDPIRVERSSLAVMDGHHRLAAARLLALTMVPCVAYKYSEVLVTSMRCDYAVDEVTIIARALTGDLFPFKTTRHAFPDQPKSAILIQALRTSMHPDVLLSKHCRPCQ